MIIGMDLITGTITMVIIMDDTITTTIMGIGVIRDIVVVGGLGVEYQQLVLLNTTILFPGVYASISISGS